MKSIYTFLFCALFTFSAIAQKDIIKTSKGEVIMTPIYHSTTVLQWNGKTIYMDPYGGAERFESFNKPDIVCITHPHGDHLDKSTLKDLDLSNTIAIVPESVASEMDKSMFKEVKVIPNDESINLMGVSIKAFPMYNLPNDESARHKKGWGNAYILTIEGTTFYFSGDTEDIPEMRKLADIDYAFICMNLPYTMTVEKAADAVIEFGPDVVYPFHFRGKDGFSDVEKFKELVNAGNADVEVRLRDWYPEK